MSRKTYRVKGLSILQIRSVTKFLREKFDFDKLSLGKIIEIFISNDLIDVLDDQDSFFKNGAEAKYVPEIGCIFLKQSDYDSCVEDTNARSKFTFWHEMGHLFLGHSLTFARGEGIEGKEVQAFESSEWQADQFAAEILMPLDIMKAEGLCREDELVTRFGVSWEAAKVRLKQLRAHGSL